jgi:maltose-binding protein MalE
MGRDQAQMLKELTDNKFTPETGINVKMNLTQQGLIEATLAGIGPDVALFVPSSQAVNLAMRGAVYKISNFIGYGNVAADFYPESLVPYKFNGDFYGLPLTQDFYMMFYRKDIFNELNLRVPTTWDEFYNVSLVLQERNLTIGVPSTTLNSYASYTSSVPPIFATLVFQKGGELFAQDLSKTRLDENIPLDAFRQWTELFSKYSFPLSYDFYNRFRTGEMPLGFTTYSTYNMLNEAAPEIKGLWDFSLVPGTVDKNGNIHRDIYGGANSGAIIMEKSKVKEESWEWEDTKN